MRLPQWAKTIIAGALVTVIGWAINDRMQIGERLSAVEQYIKDSITRLDRIEHKVDELREKER